MPEFISARRRNLRGRADARAILVTGAYGLIGHAVVLAFRAAGERVIATDERALPPDDAEFCATPQFVADAARLAEFLEAHEIETVVHCAGISGPMLARDQPHRIFSVNVGGTLDLLEAGRLAGLRRIVLLSSASAYGRNAEARIDETAPLRARSAYGASKVAAEIIAGAYEATQGLEVVLLRPSWVYGPRRKTACVIRTMILDALAGGVTRLPFGKGFPRQFVHVADVAAAVVAAEAAPDASGQTFNLTDGTRRTLDQVAAIVRSILPQARIELDDGEDPEDDYIGLLDISRAEKHLNWRPQIALETGICSYARYLAASCGGAGSRGPD